MDNAEKQTMMDAAERAMTAAKTFILRKQRVFAAAMTRMDLKMVCSTGPDDGIPAAATDCYKQIIFDARRILQMNDDQIAFLIMHELVHKMGNHGVRGKCSTGNPEMDRLLSNVAADFIVNKIVVGEIGDHFPPADERLNAKHIDVTIDNFWPALMMSQALRQPMKLYDPSVSDNDSVESVLARLIANMPKSSSQSDGGDKKQGKQQGQPKPGPGQSEPGQGAPGQGQPGQGQPGPGQPEPGQGEPGQGQPEPGQGQGQPDMDALAKALAQAVMGRDDAGLKPENPDGSEATEAEVAAEQAVSEQAVAQAAIAEMEKRQGKAPGWLKRMVDAAKKPAINPRTLLDRYVRRRTARSDYSMRRPRKFGMAHNMLLPTLRSDEVGDLLVAIDTSGSVGDRDLAQYRADIEAVKRVMRPTSITVIYCDTRVAGVQTFKRNQPLKLKPMGGGGTILVPVFQHIADNKLKGDLLLFLTDGYATDKFPDRLKPKMPVVWLVYDGNPSFRPNFGDVVRTTIQT